MIALALLQIRVAVVGWDAPAVKLQSLGFEACVVAWADLDLNGVDVVYLPSCWANNENRFAEAEARADEIRRFVERGGGLVVGQANAFELPGKRVRPSLLPYPITFNNGYDWDRGRENLAHDHFITEDVAPEDIPFPADTLTEIDERYTVLARQTTSKNVALAVCEFGDGRAVVHSAPEGPSASVPMSDEVLRRMVVWAAARD